ncbi:expressed unknown protein [Seminavis robusta]|uniref:G-protein coupled receptors family 1 profile domain-containing protein n=1 Tax=Seminavis robusta TaxID=568900 RepID=A0A9N8ER18_9STRA|nr:expressed unknown protein [Seminavis robusta]|eukprot:Sro1377_g267520.1 n/a (403) ;mRNA; r:8222-9430
MSLTSREVAIAIVPKITGGLSIAGSGWISCQILADPKKRHKTYHRLVLLMSLCDLVSSFSYFLSTWPIPQGVNQGWKSPYHFHAVGNAATCTAQGFGIQLGVTTAFFNIMLALHYLLVIKYNYTESFLQKKERYMWAIALTLGLALSVPGLFLQMYGNTNLWCWISPSWDLCDQLGMTKDQCVSRAYNYRWAFYYAPLWTCIFLITLSQLCLWWTVRQMEVKASRWRFTSKQSKARRLQQSRRVAIQAAWYMAGFIVTWLPYTAIAMTGKFFNPHDTTGFIVLLTVVICQPSQGLINVFVYHRQSLARASSRAVGSVGESVKNIVQLASHQSRKSWTSAALQQNQQQQTLDQIRNELQDVKLTITEPRLFADEEEPTNSVTEEGEKGDEVGDSSTDLIEIYD